MATSKSRLHRFFGIDAPGHGEHTIKAEDDVNLKIISLGLSRTGTTSLAAAFDILGLGPCIQAIDLFRNRTLVEGFIALFASIIDKRITTQQAADQLRHLTRGYAASTDQPLCYLMPEVLTAFPDARFILTIRDSQQSWWDSYYEVFNVQLRTDWYRRFYRFLIFWIGFQRRMDDEVQLFQQRCANNFGAFDAELYTKHNDAVKAAVPKDQLLVYNVKQGWEPLCKHLGVAVPAEPFPNLNDRKTMQRIMLGVQVFGACTWVFYAGLAGIAVYLAAKPATNLEVMPYVD